MRGGSGEDEEAVMEMSTMMVRVEFVLEMETVVMWTVSKAGVVVVEVEVKMEMTIHAMIETEVKMETVVM